MKIIRTVITPAISYDLTVLATVKRELGITGTDSDILLEAMIDQASGVVADITGRVWASETLEEKFYFNFWERVPTLVLSRRPVSNISSIMENGVALAEDVDFAVDAERGMLYRINYTGFLNGIIGSPSVVVNYTGGYVLLDDLPYGIERATIMMVKSYFYGAVRDPGVRSETTFELDSITYRDTADAQKAVEDLLSVYSDPGWA